MKHLSRRTIRELAIKIIYQMEMTGNSAEESLDSVMEDIPENTNGTELTFLKELIAGVWEHIDKIDEAIKEHSHKWEPERLGKIEKAILRLAIYEITYRDDIPTAVSLNEAVELTKRYASEESRKFVNGILSGVVKKA